MEETVLKLRHSSPVNNDSEDSDDDLDVPDEREYNVDDHTLEARLLKI